MTQSLEQALELYIPEAALEAQPAPTAALATLARLSRPQIELIKETVARAATDLELALFVEECNTLGLNPFADEIYFIKYKSRQGGETVAMPIGIAGRRKFVYANPLYRGQVGPFWCGQDGAWKDVWLSDEPPAAAKVGIILQGNPEPTWGVVTWREFNKVGQPGDKFWRQSPAHMLAIRAESHAARKVAEQAPAPASPIITAEYLATKAEQIQRDQALPARTPPPTDAQIKQQIFQPEDEPQPEDEQEQEQEPELELEPQTAPGPVTLTADQRQYLINAAATALELTERQAAAQLDRLAKDNLGHGLTLISPTEARRLLAVVQRKSRAA